VSDICQFIPPKERPAELSFFHFVYETELKRLKQPFSHSNYYVHVVFKGDVTLNTSEKSYRLKRGDVFFTQPFQKYTLNAENNFSYMCISFNGKGALPLLNEHNVSKENCVFYNLENIIPFWIDSIRRLKPSNANTIAESVLLYTFSFIDVNKTERFEKIEDKFDSIIDYLSLNFTSNDLCLKKIAELFFYTEKHLSHLFVKKTGKKFTQHVNQLRIQYAMGILKEKDVTLEEVASRCGFSDKFYFAKVFKKIVGKTPTAYLNELKRKQPIKNE